MKNIHIRKRPFGKVTLTFTSVIIGLITIVIVLGLVMSNTINSLQTHKSSLENQITAFQTNNGQLQTNYSSLQSKYNSLQSQLTQLQSNNSQLQGNNRNLQSQLSTFQTQYASLQSIYNLSQTDLANLQNQISNLQLQLSNATVLISQLQGPTGILPTYSDLAYVGPSGSGGAYFLQLSLKNTGPLPITQIFVTLNSIQIPMSFTYLNVTVSSSAPLPSYQTATGIQNVTPPITSVGTYPLVIQALANNGTTYTYQTTITSHV